MAMKRFTSQQYAKILYDITFGLKGEKEISKAALSFANLLKRKRATKKMNEIIEAFKDFSNEKSGKYAVAVSSARPLTASVKKILQDKFSALIKEELVDEKLVGGVVIKAKSVLFDASVKGQLQRLRECLLV